jgi:hypothetical protein
MLTIIIGNFKFYDTTGEGVKWAPVPFKISSPAKGDVISFKALTGFIEIQDFVAAGSIVLHVLCYT